MSAPPYRVCLRDDTRELTCVADITNSPDDDELEIGWQRRRRPMAGLPRPICGRGAWRAREGGRPGRRGVCRPWASTRPRCGVLSASELTCVADITNSPDDDELEIGNEADTRQPLPAIARSDEDSARIRAAGRGNDLHNIPKLN